MIRLISDDDALGLGRDSAAVCIVIDSEDARQAQASVQSVLAHSDAFTPLILTGTSAALEQIEQELGTATEQRAVLGLISRGDTEVSAFAGAARASAPGDVVLVSAGTYVTSGWLERLRVAALSDSTIASATPLSLGPGGTVGLGVARRSDHAASTSPPKAESPVAEEAHGDLGDLEEATRLIRRVASPLHPRIATIGPCCAYIRRTALELGGLPDESEGLEEALAKLAVRTTALGMVHIAAADVLVVNRSGRGRPVEGFPEDPPRQRRLPDGYVETPPGQQTPAEGLEASERPEDYTRETIAGDEQGPLRRSLNRARAALGQLSVTIDGRSLNAAVGGTQTYIIELILALARGGGVSVRVLIPPDLSERASGVLASVPEVELLTYEQAIAGPVPTDAVHRPQQVFTPDDLTLLRAVGERVVIGQQDLVAYHNFSYHRDAEAWRAYRRTTRLALAGADQAIFFSEHARRDALAEDLLPVGRTHVVGIGTEAIEPSSSPGSPPAGLSPEGPFLLCLGADYAHKNRPFAIQLLGALRDLGWDGQLVLAGTHVPHGSSREDEQQLLRSKPELAKHTVDLGVVDEAVKKWLYAHASTLLYPTIYEGFGLLPVEAARAGLPCLFASQASLSELAGGAATLVPWDARTSAAAVLPLLSDSSAREAHLAKLRELSVPSWGEVAQRLVAVYEHALAAPPSEAAPRIWQEFERENYIVKLDQDITDLKRLAQEYQDAYHSLEARVSTGLPLIDEGGLLSPAQQRGLMRIAGRGRLGALAVAPLGILGRRSEDFDH
jgi:hypothetical protein